MTDILTRMRAMTRESLAGVRTDFDDAPKYHVAAPKNTGMIRIVEGADDLAYTGPRNQNPGMITLPTTEDLADTGHNRETCDNPRCCPDPNMPVTGASPAQVNLIRLRLTWLAEHDADAAAAMTDWLDRGGWGTLAGGKGGSASQLIDRIKAKHAEAKESAKVVRVTERAATTFDAYDDIPTGNYALGEDDDIKFYRVNHHKNGRLYVDVYASDERHPVRNWATRKAVLDGIREMGWEISTRLYGSKIGSCGRCNRTLTDATSRAYGIGPDCRSKM
jgi:hypothetical protein